ncbi:MAG TPA: hypothetical protein PK926_12420 [Spirochaetota bacterium]|nr:hypothetical protein [Spirochaetota bacterium]HPI88919.1 hypothetical protein [Spirochaetota bacterium]HPR46604.1 hypothetical protein [Spirochaetota bacterium]
MNTTIVMKLRLYAITAIACLVVAFTPTARGATMAIGWNSWLNWWEIPEENMEQHYVDIDFNVFANFLNGPVLSLQITPRWGLSAMFIFGFYDSAALFENYDYTIWRFDLDTTATYAFTSWFRLYFGFKYLRYTWDYDYDNGGWGDTTLRKKLTTVSDNFAPGLGCVFTIPLYKSLYFSLSLGSLFSFTVMDQDYKITNYETDSITYRYSDDYFGYEAGLNSKLSLCYDAIFINTIFTTGFRYQVFFYFFDNGGKIKYSDRVDHMYGIDVMTIFYFDI